MITYLTANVLEVCDSLVRLRQWSVHLFKRFGAVISSDTLCLDVVKKVLN